MGVCACFVSPGWCNLYGPVKEGQNAPVCGSKYEQENCPHYESKESETATDDTPPLDRALEAIEAVYQNHPDDKMTAFLILRYTIEERINDIKDEREAGNDAS